MGDQVWRAFSLASVEKVLQAGQAFVERASLGPQAFVKKASRVYWGFVRRASVVEAGLASVEKGSRDEVGMVVALAFVKRDWRDVAAVEAVLASVRREPRDVAVVVAAVVLASRASLEVVHGCPWGSRRVREEWQDLVLGLASRCFVDCPELEDEGEELVMRLHMDCSSLRSREMHVRFTPLQYKHSEEGSSGKGAAYWLRSVYGGRMCEGRSGIGFSWGVEILSRKIWVVHLHVSLLE